MLKQSKNANLRSTDDSVVLSEVLKNDTANTAQKVVHFDEESLRYQTLLDEATQINQEFQLLCNLQNVISTKLNVQKLLTTVVQTLNELFKYDRVSIDLVQDSQLVTLVSHSLDEDTESQQRINSQIFEEICQTKVPQIIYFSESIESVVEIKPWVLHTPLWANDEVIGILSIGHKQKDYTERDQSLMTKVAKQLSLAIENAKLHTQVSQDLKRTEALYKISQAIHDSKELDDFMTTILEVTSEAVNAHWGIFQKIDSSGNYIEHSVQTKDNFDELEEFQDLTNGVIGLVIRQREPALISRYRSTPKSVHMTYLDEYAIGSAIIAPLVHENRVSGFLSLRRPIDAVDYVEEDIKLIKIITRQVAVAFAQYELKQLVEHQAFHDPLTGLANRLFFEEELRQQFLNTQEKQSYFATIVLDLDGFKDVNDLLGHDVGDELLIAVSKRLQGCTSKKDTLARMGGDEFVVLVKNLPSKEAIKPIAQRYLSVLKNSFSLNPHIVTIGTSIGASFYPDDGADMHTLLKHADIAMYEAKHLGKNTVCLFTPELSSKSQKRFEIENDLQRALENSELELYYQPQYSLTKNELVGVEALLRWNHPRFGFLTPNQFLSTVQDRDLLIKIGKWVLFEACQQNIMWQVNGHKALKVAINISALQFASEGFIDDLKTILKETGLEARWLEIELTERMVMQDTSKVLEQLHSLKDLGVSIAIDDFGTGYLSLALIKKLPLDKLKIDCSFVSEISEETDTPIVASILAIAQSLRLKTIAEGVETLEQLEYLRIYGCSEAQGYYFSKPLEAREIWNQFTSS